MITDIDGSRILTPNEYQKLAARTDPDRTIQVTDKIIEIAPRGSRLLHSVLGLMGELGELASALQRWLYYNKELDVVNIVEEFGDAEWYISQGCRAVNATLEDVMKANLNKLKFRYPERYTDFHAAEENRDRSGERKEIGREFKYDPLKDQVSNVNVVFEKTMSTDEINAVLDSYGDVCIEAMAPVGNTHVQTEIYAKQLERVAKTSTEAMEYVARQTGPRPAPPVCPKCKTIVNKGYCAECCERTV